jgi:hypothetical protein
MAAKRTKAPALPFAFAPAPPDYPGKALWFTLRWRAHANVPVWGKYGRFLLEENRPAEWVSPSQLAVGDSALGGTLLAIVAVAGRPAWKVALGLGGTGYKMLDGLPEKVERTACSKDVKHAQLEYDGAPELFSNAGVVAALGKIHALRPILAAFFQEGQFVSSDGLLDLSDEALVARLGQS